MNVGDVVRCVIPKYPAHKWGEGTIRAVQSSGDGFTVDFENGETGLLFSMELSLVRPRENNVQPSSTETK